MRIKIFHEGHSVDYYKLEERINEWFQKENPNIQNTHLKYGIGAPDENGYQEQHLVAIVWYKEKKKARVIS